MHYTSLSIIIDDIVFPDGRTAMGVLGGGGMYSVAGMRIWSDDVGLLANVAADFDEAIIARLALRPGGLRRGPRPTPRAWQLFEEDGHRTQIPRVREDDWAEQLRWPDDLAEQLRVQGVRAIHLPSRGLPGNREMVAQLAGEGVRISLEPIIEDGLDHEQRAGVLACLPHVEIFSPGLGELQALMGDTPAERALPALAERGPSLVALRMGAAGSLVYERASERFLRVPAAPATVVDVTGAGNAYAGGMLVGWCTSGDLATAAACAAVSAALTIEQIGPPTITPALLAAAGRRQAELLAALRETMIR